MSENGNKETIRAGQAFMAALEADPEAKQYLSNAVKKLRMFAASARATSVPIRPAMEALKQVLARVDAALMAMGAERRKLIEDELAELRAEKEQAFAELRRNAETAINYVSDDLASLGFDPPANDLESWEELARIVEKESRPMTMEEIYLWAIAWAKRELLRRKMDSNETSRNSDQRERHLSVRSSEEASIFRDEHDPTIAWCVGKRIYLGNDTQISRLFWLLASPLGRACSLGEVQRAVNFEESSRDMDISAEQYKKANQSVRKAVSKLRARLIEAGAENHLIINPGGGQKNPEYTMVLRFG